jgi:CO/xanthine dehydrogenase FAD-binding subunit
MRAFVPAYDLRAPGTLTEALHLLASDPGAWRPFSGGTDLMVQFDAGALPEGRYLGLWKLHELRGIENGDNSVSIGALTTYTEILHSDVLKRDFAMLCQAAAETGGVATQNRGTIGGNIANASPAADTPPALLAYDAELELISVRGVRRVPYDRFHLGYKKMDLAPGELIARVHLPRRPGRWREYYRKVGTRRAQAIAKVCMAAAMDLDPSGVVRDARIALGSVAPTVIRARRTEDALRGQTLDPDSLRRAQQALASDVAPIDDIRSTARYRLNVAQRLLGEGVSEIRGN